MHLNWPEAFYTEKRTAEAEASSGNVDAGEAFGSSEQEDPDAIETDLEELAKMDEVEAAKAEARKKAEEEAKQIIATVDDLQTRAFDENIFVQSSLVNMIDLKFKCG